ncbi:STAS domain-containing protein [Mesobacillus foraminis]|uniref:STAS domain-containing protein n=1 Tax=Mesobacillus foraminis TaxID=279826 RepID=UPI001BE5DF67|nr:STAS domain-containing protein [Mesobacillus foraminis]MBT2757972.1 STAS domain-containing protein [Mesobacillus foraminis]
MNTLSTLNREIKNYINDNKLDFESNLLKEAVNVSERINDILERGNINLLKNAQRLINYVVDQEDSELILFAKQEGIAWAEHELTLALKLEWVQAIRRTLWRSINTLDEKHSITIERNDFYSLEKMINDKIDQFLNNFFISYSKYKDSMFHKQRETVEHLSVPIIPVSPAVFVLPLIGSIDSYRVQIIEEKVLHDIAESRIQTLVIDLSGIAMMEKNVIDSFEKILSGIAMMGCNAVITGLRPDLVKTMIHSGIRLGNRAETQGTLQETLKKYL